MTPDKEAIVLAIPETCIDKIIALYHTSLFAGHQGVVKTYLTNEGQIFHSKSDALFETFHKGMPCMSINRQQDSYNLEFI